MKCLGIAERHKVMPIAAITARKLRQDNRNPRFRFSSGELSGRETRLLRSGARRQSPFGKRRGSRMRAEGVNRAGVEYH